MKLKSKKINLHIAPGNWNKIQEKVVAYNGDPSRTSPKLKFTDIVNDAIRVYFENIKPRSEVSHENSNGER